MVSPNGPDLEDEFAASLHETLERIRLHPMAYECEGPFRRAILHRFPYRIIYVTTAAQIVVVAVLHTSREPRAWQDRDHLKPRLICPVCQQRRNEFPHRVGVQFVMPLPPSGVAIRPRPFMRGFYAVRRSLQAGLHHTPIDKYMTTASTCATIRLMTTDIDITRLTRAERILLVQELWDSLAPSQASQPLTPVQQQELERRLASADRGEVSYSSWEDVKHRVLPEG